MSSSGPYRITSQGKLMNNTQLLMDALKVFLVCILMVTLGGIIGGFVGYRNGLEKGRQQGIEALSENIDLKDREHKARIELYKNMLDNIQKKPAGTMEPVRDLKDTRTDKEIEDDARKWLQDQGILPRE